MQLPRARQVISGVSGSNSYCLDIPGGQQTAGLAMQIYRCNGTVSQMWQLRPSLALVPNVYKLSEIAATNQVSSYDLTPIVAYSNKCISPGSVIGEHPDPGSLQALNSPVYLTNVDSAGTNCAKKVALFGPKSVRQDKGKRHHCRVKPMSAHGFFRHGENRPRAAGDCK